MRVVFMGTPDFAAEVLDKIVTAGHEVVGVVTQPDKPKGRGGAMAMSAVKEKALEYGITIYQPEKVKNNPEFMETMKQLNPDVSVVVAFGQILPQALLDVPQYGSINVHASLLPAYRGAAPIQWAVIDGLAKTGVTTMQMDAGIDTGDIIMQKELELNPKETGGSLFDRLSKAGAELLVQTLEALQNHTASWTKQDDTKSNYAKMLDKSMGNIDFSQPADVLERLIRGLNPWPSAYTYLAGKTLKIWDADVAAKASNQDAQPGTVIETAKDYFVVACGAHTALRINEVQMEGKKRMPAELFLRGYHLEEGITLKMSRDVE